jgi:hypothetical protein
MVLDAWSTYLERTDKLINSLSEEQLQKEVSPGRNSGIYLLGHLTAVHDALFPLLGFGAKLYPELEEVFIKNPDKSGLEKPPVNVLKEYWHKVNSKLSGHFSQLTMEEWFQKHEAISHEDFKKEPHRNKLNVVLNRTNHLANHLGQLVFLS